MKLHRDLQQFVGRRTLRHPLLGNRRYIEACNAVYNREYESKQALLRQAMAAGNWRNVVWLHERPYRVQALLEYAKLMPDAEFWRLAGEVWIDAESIQHERSAWIQIWTTERPARDQLMTADEHRVLAKIPDGKVAIYRGFPAPQALHGLSWTFDRDQAIESGHRLLAAATVPKHHIQAFFSLRRPGRPDEVVVLGRHCHVEKVEPITGQRAA